MARKRVIRGYWDCQSCDTKGIDGLLDKCPNCGAGKPANTKYYMKDKRTVSETDLEKAGIGKVENDGKHKEWVCPYCGQLNNFRDLTCVSCGASKDSKELEYGDYERQQSAKTKPVQNRQFHLPGIVKILLVILVVLLFPLRQSQEVTDRYWETIVHVEESHIVQESGWTLPSEATLIEQKTELRRYDSVVDYYETVAVTRSRSVQVGTEEYCSYDDNGNGTFTESCYDEPVYETEYYTDYEDRPVYTQKPVYDTKYYYTIPRWEIINSYTKTGKDNTPVYETGYTLSENQRDTNKELTYYVSYDGKDPVEIQKSEYEQIEIGSQFVVWHNLLGMEYSRKLTN